MSWKILSRLNLIWARPLPTPLISNVKKTYSLALVHLQITFLGKSARSLKKWEVSYG
jgi:hypothetical protein